MRVLRPVLLLALLLAMPLALSFPAQADSTTPQATRYYFLSDATGAEYTLFAHQVLSGTDNASILFALPHGTTPSLLTDQDGRLLHWADEEDGWIQVAVTNTTRTFTATVRGLPGPDTQLPPPRFPDDLFPHYIIYLGLPEGYQPRDGDPIDRAALEDRLGAFPLPEDRTYHQVRPDTLGATVDVRPTGPDPAAPYALLAVLIGLLALTTLWLMVRVHKSATDPTRQKEMPIMQHLEELRRRVMWIVGVLFVGGVFFFTFGFRWIALAGYRLPLPVPSIYGNAAAQVFAWLARRVVPPNVQVVVVSPWDAVVTQITIAISLAMLVAFPVFFYHVYAFLAPALHPKERRAVLYTVPVVVVLFALGAVFGLGFMLPFLVSVLYSFAGTLGAIAFLNVPDLVALGALNAVVFGIAFELPVVMALLSAIGVVPAAAWRRYWRHATLIIVIVAALVTDPTVITQLIVAAVLGILYAIGIVLAIIFEKKATHTGPAASKTG